MKDREIRPKKIFKATIAKFFLNCKKKNYQTTNLKDSTNPDQKNHKEKHS